MAMFTSGNESKLASRWSVRVNVDIHYLTFPLSGREKQLW